MNAQTTESTETFSIIFSDIERRLLFETKFLELKQQISGKELQTPLFLREIALPKTRAGLLFCCASPTLPFKANLINVQQPPSNQNNVNQKAANLDKSAINALLNQNSIFSSPMHTLANNPALNATTLNSTANQNVTQTSSCSTSTSISTVENEQDIWICNSDGYVGQVCILSLTSDPTVTSCNGVCNSRILCIVAVPVYR